MGNENYIHWIVERDKHDIVWLKIDVSGKNTNVLSSEVLLELNQIIELINTSLPAGVVIISNKKKGFIAGADIKEFTTIRDKNEALSLIQIGQQAFTKLDKLKCITVAVLNGFTLGGGLELALACDYRLALDSSETRLSLPEIKLGIHPGYGGTVRIFRYLNPLVAMNLMLTGRSISVYQAKKMGLIDFSVAARQLENAALKIIQTKPEKTSAPKFSKLFNSKIIRKIVAVRMRKQVSKKARQDHYPAPYALVDHWVENFGNESVMLQKEAESVAELSTNSTTKNLVRVFLLQDELKSLADGTTKDCTHVHIIGAGIMGGDIATWCVSKGLTVTLQDLNSESLAKAKQRAYKYFKKRLRDKFLIKNAMDQLILDKKGIGLKSADVIIEAIFENKKVKRELYTTIEPIIKPDAILATNTSSIKIEDLCDVLTEPSRLLGLHFFNPVVKMPLVEIVNGTQTDADISQAAVNFAKQIGKLPLPTKSSPGFLVNRVLTPYMVEAGLMKESGISIADIDKAATEFGMPMGPIELADTVGLDVGLHVAELLSKAYKYTIPNSFKNMVENGNLGKKSGQGFYNWKNGKKVKIKTTSSIADLNSISNRLIFRFLNEAMACKRQKIVENEELLDAGIIFGTGFAPFTGGPMNYIHSQGKSSLLQELNSLENQYGDRFKADPEWFD